MIQRGRPQLSLKGRALRYLSQREHSRGELERKLAKYADGDEEVPRVLDELQARGFIDHQRVADSVVNQRASRFGAMRIRQELQGKGLEPELVSKTIRDLRETEIARAREVWARKFDAPAADAAQAARQARFLAARGFDAEVVRAVLRQLRRTDER